MEENMQPKIKENRQQKETATDHNRRYAVSPALYDLRKYFVYVLVGGLILSAFIAIVAVLIGNMNDLVGKTIATVLIIIVHSLIALGFISVTSSRQPNTGSSVVINTLFVITVLSLITAMLGVWGIITDSELIARQYMVFLSAIVTSVIIYGLFQATERDRPTVISRNTAIGSTLVSFALLLPILYDVGALPEMYYRVLTAVDIVVGVSIVITVIFHWLYIAKHPELRSNTEHSPMSFGKLIGKVILVFIAIWIAIAIIGALFNSFAPRHYYNDNYDYGSNRYE